MNNQWKMAPVEPTAEMEDAGCQAYMDADGMIGIMHKSSMGHAFQAMLSAAPVPPAGDVEVLARTDSLLDSKVGLTDAGLRLSLAGRDDVELVDRAHVTRLTAELDGLLSEVAELKQQVEWRGEMAASNEREYTKQIVISNALQSELTKARELLVGHEWLVDGEDHYCPECFNFKTVGHERACKLAEFLADQPSKIATPIAPNADESCGQDAEAANICQRVGCSHEICESRVKP